VAELIDMLLPGGVAACGLPERWCPAVHGVPAGV